MTGVCVHCRKPYINEDSHIKVAHPEQLSFPPSHLPDSFKRESESFDRESSSTESSNHSFKGKAGITSQEPNKRATRKDSPGALKQADEKQGASRQAAEKDVGGESYFCYIGRHHACDGTYPMTSYEQGLEHNRYTAYECSCPCHTKKEGSPDEAGKRVAEETWIEDCDVCGADHPQGECPKTRTARKVYHVAPVRVRESIQRHGIDPTKAPYERSTAGPYWYGFDSLGQARWYLYQMNDLQDPMEIWEVEVDEEGDIDWVLTSEQTEELGSFEFSQPARKVRLVGAKQAKLYKCQTCGKEFDTISAYSEHQRQHGKDNSPHRPGDWGGLDTAPSYPADRGQDVGQVYTAGESLCPKCGAKKGGPKWQEESLPLHYLRECTRAHQVSRPKKKEHPQWPGLKQASRTFYHAAPDRALDSILIEGINATHSRYQHLYTHPANFLHHDIQAAREWAIKRVGGDGVVLEVTLPDGFPLEPDPNWWGAFKSYRRIPPDYITDIYSLSGNRRVLVEAKRADKSPNYTKTWHVNEAPPFRWKDDDPDCPRCGSKETWLIGGRANLGRNPKQLRISPATWQCDSCGFLFNEMDVGIDKPRQAAAYHKPWTGPAKAYPVADSVAEALEALKRNRKGATIILSDEALRKEEVICRVCGDPILPGDANRCEYHASTKTLKPMHYDCAWGQTLQEVEDLAIKMRDKLASKAETYGVIHELQVTQGREDTCSCGALLWDKGEGAFDKHVLAYKRSQENQALNFYKAYGESARQGFGHILEALEAQGIDISKGVAGRYAKNAGVDDADTRFCPYCQKQTWQRHKQDGDEQDQWFCMHCGYPTNIEDPMELSLAPLVAKTAGRYYHVAPVEVHDSIMSEGLNSTASRWAFNTPGNYVFATQADAKLWIDYIKKEEEVRGFRQHQPGVYPKSWSGDFVVYEVEVDDSKVVRDPYLGGYKAYLTKERIPPENIRTVLYDTGDELKVARWDEQKHPRDLEGRFREKDGPTKGPTKGPGQQKGFSEAADALVEQAKRKEKRIAPAIQSLALRTGGEVVGFEHRIKEKDSVERKIKDRAQRFGLGAEGASKKLKDSLRFTVAFHPQQYVSGVKKVLQELKAQGITPASDEFENYWSRKDTDAYQGMNLVLKDKEGFLFELQIHTPQSFEAKEMNHPDYKEFRVSKDPSTRKRLWDKMRERAEAIPIPRGVEALGLATVHSLVASSSPPVSPTVFAAAKEVIRLATLKQGKQWQEYFELMPNRVDPDVPTCYFRKVEEAGDVRFETRGEDGWETDNELGRHLVFGELGHYPIGEDRVGQDDSGDQVSQDEQDAKGRLSDE